MQTKCLNLKNFLNIVRNKIVHIRTIQRNVRINYFELKRNHKAILDFKKAHTVYKHSLSELLSQTSGFGRTLYGEEQINDTPQDLQLRERVNKLSYSASIALHKMGLGYISYTPPPAIGGPIIKDLDVILNVLNPSFSRSLTTKFVTDLLDQALGRYETEIRRAFLKLFNPFYWLRLILVFIIRIPFEIVALAGIDISNFETGFFGKTIKLAESILVILVSLQALGWLVPLKSAIWRIFE